MKIKLTSILLILLILASGLTGCSKDDPKDVTSEYGSLDGNLIAVGSTRNVSYTSFIVLGTVDFPKITSEHTYGIVYMEEVSNQYFDYSDKLVYGGHGSASESESYYCTDLTVSNSSVDGKFEKKVSDLKPATTYYYRAFVKVGNNFNYSKVEKVTTSDPATEISLTTLEATDIHALNAMLNAEINLAGLQDETTHQEYGFIYSDSEKMSTPETLTLEYYNTLVNTSDADATDVEKPKKVEVNESSEGKISCVINDLTPGTNYYYRAFFCWNGKYFYSPVVASFTTLSSSEIAVSTFPVSEITDKSASLNAKFPYSLTGLEKVRAGFMLSKKYSDPALFNMKYAEPLTSLNGRDSDLWYVETLAESDNYSITVNNLENETTYYVVAFICLGGYGDDALYLYGNVESFTTSKLPQSNIEVTSGGAFPWKETGEGTWTSGNKGMHNTTSTLVITFTPKPGESLSFKLNVDCEKGYDKVRIKGEGLTTEEYSGAYIIDFVSAPYTYAVPTTVTVEYIKDGYGSAGTDEAIVSDITLKKIQSR